MAIVESFDHHFKEKTPSERSFAFTLAGVFALMGLYGVIRGRWYWPYVDVAALLFLGFGYFSPQHLRFLNRAWAKFGELMAAVVTPVVLSILFYCAFLPVGLLMRIFSKDFMNLSLVKSQKSYWKNRGDQRSFNDDFFKAQF